jgi:hypothetical protein
MQPENDDRLQQMLGSLSAPPGAGRGGEVDKERAESFARAASLAGSRSRRNLRFAAGACVMALAAGTAMMLNAARGPAHTAPPPSPWARLPPTPESGCDVRLLTLTRLNASVGDELVLPTCGGVNWVTRQRILD